MSSRGMNALITALSCVLTGACLGHSQKSNFSSLHVAHSELQLLADITPVCVVFTACLCYVNQSADSFHENIVLQGKARVVHGQSGQKSSRPASLRGGLVPFIK